MTKKKSKIATREEILARLQLPAPIEKHIDEIGMTIRLKCPSFRRIAEIKIEHQSPAEINVALAVECCADLKPEDAKALLDGSPTVAAAIVNAALAVQKIISKDDLGKQ